MFDDNILYSSQYCEDALLGRLLLDPAYHHFEDIVKRLPSFCFYSEFNAKLYETMFMCYDKYNGFDIPILLSYPKIIVPSLDVNPGLEEMLYGLRDRLYGLVKNSPETSNLDIYIDIIIEKYKRRFIAKTAKAITTELQDSDSDKDNFDCLVKKVQRKIEIFFNQLEYLNRINNHAIEKRC